MKQFFISCLILAATLPQILHSTKTEAAEQQRPNFVIILADEK